MPSGGLSGMEPALSVYRELLRALSSPLCPFGAPRVAVLALSGAMVVGGAGLGLAQGMSEQQVRCLQLQQELVAARGGGGANREELGRIEQQIAQADRVFQGTRASMEDAGCFESFFIFGRGLVRSPKCLKMNDRVEESRRQLAQLQQQRQALTGGGGNKRRQAELQAAMARSGCGGVRAPQPARRGGGLFDFFGGGQQQEAEELPQTPIYRSIDPNGRYRSVCVRLCDGFYYPVSYATYGARLGQDATQCQSNCAAPAELYVYRNPGQEIEHAVSLSGSAYMDLPVALRYRKEYVKGCSCKQAEYNPTAIESASKRADVNPSAQPASGNAPVAPPALPQEAVPQAAAPAEDGAMQFDPEITGSNEPAPPPAPEAAPPVAVPQTQQPPAPPPAAEAPPPPLPPPPTAEVAPPPPPAPAAQPAQSSVTKRKPAAAPPPSPFTPQF